MTVRTIGVKELAVDMETMRLLLRKPEIITKDLDRLMHKHAPERTGYLKRTIYHKGNVAGVTAPYGGFVEEMGKKYAYATLAIKAFKMDDYADEVTEPF